MATQFETQTPLNLLVCTRCKGFGFVGLRRCAICKGKGVGRLSGKDFLFWKTPLTRYHITLRRAMRVLWKFEMIGALLFSLGFFGLFFWTLYAKGLLGTIITSDFWLAPTDPLPTLFWLGVISVSFYLYRHSSGRRDPKPLARRGYNGQPLPEELNKTADWEAVLKMSGRHRKDISMNFSEDALVALERSYRTGDRYHSKEITSMHIFFALLGTDRIGSVFLRLGIPAKTIQAYVAKNFVSGNPSHAPIFSEEALQVVFHSYDSAVESRQLFVEDTDLLVSVVRQSTIIQEILYDLKVDKQTLDNVVEWLRIRERLRHKYREFRKIAARRDKHGIDRAMTAIATPYLNSFSQDLTLAAQLGYMAPTVARDKEIDEVFRVIEGGRQSIVLVGDSGVGKMSIVEGIAERMVEGGVPKQLQDKRLVQVSTSALLAGTTVSGAQERLMKMMNEVIHAKNIILFIKNIHDLVSVSGGNGGEGLDISETLAEYLGPGQILTLTTTTKDGFNKHILNSELGSLLAKVSINEMNENQAIQVLESKVGGIEYKHRIFVSYAALAQAVRLAKRFLYDQRLPESAVSLLTEAASAVKSKKGENNLVGSEDVAAIVSDKTGIPTTSITEDEGEKLMRLESVMHERVIGQDEAVRLVASALRRARAEVRSTNRPIANFLFLGPTGVGKTELAKTIAEVYFGGEKRMVRIDMSEYQDKSSIYRLIGQPGMQGTGILTEGVRQQPFSLVLLDELEKADPDILNLFLQVFDDGRLTDSVGRVIDFSNTIIIATSNAGTQFVSDRIAAGADQETILEELHHGELKQYYKPEFLNRFDGVVLFRSLGKDEIKRIARLMLKRVAKDIESRGVFLRVEDTALEALAEVGFDPEFGARPMRRAIQDMIENKLADSILQGTLNRRDTVVIGKNAEIRIEHAL